ncbi:hypothetical protein PPERSA_10323 [Pseudocohnilembus persalinus]|uniref:Uncharacterized protein n=1 Tax=Pseudocohnilembus persalinus TaxID=266149 RepID=A0A0V0R048_PSEPJ|nr:hypothetical protein PPERSA_10323 [Pseudocohnilembus persalinus]|eukprot:KRX07935.1 hypothetical protein PPERSA_10323 [Pseudocohnilembus persalinus]
MLKSQQCSKHIQNSEISKQKSEKYFTQKQNSQTQFQEFIQDRDDYSNKIEIRDSTQYSPAIQKKMQQLENQYQDSKILNQPQHQNSLQNIQCFSPESKKDNYTKRYSQIYNQPIQLFSHKSGSYISNQNFNTNLNFNLQRVETEGTQRSEIKPFLNTNQSNNNKDTQNLTTINTQQSTYQQIPHHQKIKLYKNLHLNTKKQYSSTQLSEFENFYNKEENMKGIVSHRRRSIQQTLERLKRKNVSYIKQGLNNIQMSPSLNYFFD